MNQLIFRIVLYLSSIMQVYSALQVISSSFQGSIFSDTNDWVVSGGQAKYTDCSGNRLFGGFNGFASRISVSKSFEFPPHAQINLQVQFWKIDSWDNEYAYIFVDFQIAWQRRFQYYDGTQMCGENWQEFCANLNLNINHSGPTAVVVFTSNLDEGPDNESWGIRDFVLPVLLCPDGCLVCQLNDQLLTCYVWKIVLLIQKLHLLLIVAVLSCDIDQAAIAFQQNQLMNPIIPYNKIPYKVQYPSYLQKVSENLKDTTSIFAIKYDDYEKQTYHITTLIQKNRQKRQKIINLS